ncbi:MAG: Na+/H+ antiporter NhaA [Chromatiales bacterium]|nr:MAG: Na+/H+ antiporter NhaA [Chromatiales bacterium]
MFPQTFREFFRLEAAGGVLLLIAAVLAMLTKNSFLGEEYSALLNVPIQIRIGALDIDKPLFLWVNDGLMAVFFFLIGMEVKREVLVGELSEVGQLALPGMAGIGGILVPAVIYYALNLDVPMALKGWAVPTATDIAFALGLLALVGNTPPALKLFLMTLAIIDDLGAIIIIALFYSSDLSLGSLLVAMASVTGLVFLTLKKVRRIAPYIIVGLILWTSVLKSGVHATLAGVVLGLFIPLGDENDSPLDRLLHDLHPWVAFGVLPLFAFVNAGVPLAGFGWDALLKPVPLGIALGLFVGKQVGAFGFAWITIRSGIAKLPAGTNMLQIYGASVLCGVGFTMSMFIGSLAFEEGGLGYGREARLGIMLGSLLSGVLGFAVLKLAGRKSAKIAIGEPA